MPFDRERIKSQAAHLAAQGVLVGTSSWKYEGWLGQLYTPGRYETRGRPSAARFRRDCLSEYAEVFKTVCVDAAYYDFPRSDRLRALADQVPNDFRFALKVTDAITIKAFPNLPRFGAKAGRVNPDFLNADLFANAFLKSCEAIRPQIAVLMFEFSRFWPKDYAHGREFVADLDRFLAALPAGWPYTIEMRNRPWLVPEYFGVLSRNRVAHVFNSWEAMPSVSDQLLLPNSRTHPEILAARFLLTPGRKYETAVEEFQPYREIKQLDKDARKAGAALMIEGLRYEPRRKTYIYVNNRLEGNALATIAAMLEILDQA